MHRHFNRVRAPQAIKSQCPLEGVDYKGFPHPPLWIEFIAAIPTHPCRKPFIEPQAIPEIHGHQVSKPLMGQLMLHNFCDSLLGCGTSCFLVEKKIHDAVSHQTPILHSSSSKVRD